MAYELFISEEARQELRALPEPLRKNIGRRIQQLQDQFTGDRGRGILHQIMKDAELNPQDLE